MLQANSCCTPSHDGEHLRALGRGVEEPPGDGLVPAITEKRWGTRQFPQMDAYGSDFPLARQVAALAPTPDDAIVIPIKPTHVSTDLLPVFKEAGGTGAIAQQLPPYRATPTASPSPTAA